jgi:hypothetical protein
MASPSFTEDHLVEQPAVQLMQHELGWEVVNCYDEWSGGVSQLGRDGKREVVLVSRLRPALQRLNPDLPVEAFEGAVEEICRDRTALSLAEANREIDRLWWPPGWVLFAQEPDRQCNRLRMNELLVEWKTSVAVSPLGETERLSEIPVRKLMESLFSRNRESGEIVKNGLSFTKNRLFTTT